MKRGGPSQTARHGDLACSCPALLPSFPPTPVLSLGGPQVAARHETVQAESRTRRHIVGHQQVVKAQHQTEHAKYLINVTC